MICSGVGLSCKISQNLGCQNKKIFQAKQTTSYRNFILTNGDQPPVCGCASQGTVRRQKSHQTFNIENFYKCYLKDEKKH